MYIFLRKNSRLADHSHVSANALSMKLIVFSVFAATIQKTKKREFRLTSIQKK